MRKEKTGTMNKYQELAANYYSTKVDQDLRFHKFTAENKNTLIIQFLDMNSNIMYPVHTYCTNENGNRHYHQVLCQKPLSENHECILCNMQYSDEYKNSDELQNSLMIKRSDKYYGLAVAYKKATKGATPDFQLTEYTISKEQWDIIQKKNPNLNLTATEDNGHMIIKNLPNVAIYSTSRKQSSQLMNEAIMDDINTPEEMSQHYVKIMRTGTGLSTEYSYRWGADPITLDDPLIQVSVDCILPLEELFDKWGNDEAYTSFSHAVSMCVNPNGNSENVPLGGTNGTQETTPVNATTSSDPWGQSIDPALLAAVDKLTDEPEF